MNKTLLKRLDNLEQSRKQAIEDKYLPVIIIRQDSDLKQYEGMIGPHTKIIKIVARKERVN